MAHPVRRGPFGWLGDVFVALLSGYNGAGPGGFTARFFGWFVPKEQRRREFAAVLALLVVATAISASLPGGWAEPTLASTSTQIAAGLTPVDSSPTPDSSTPAPAPYVEPSPAPLYETPTLPPTPKPTPAPTKMPAPGPAVAAKVYTFVALGDSLTAWPSDASWPTRLDAEDANLRLVNNAGVPGDTTADMLARLNSDVFAYKPEVLFIMGGTNDLGHNFSQATTIANLRAIIIAANAKGIRIDLMTIPPDAYTDMAAKIDSLNAAIVHLGNAYKLVVIDIHTPLSTSTGVYVPKYTIDGLHFSPLGAQVVANTIYSRIHRYGF